MILNHARPLLLTGLLFAGLTTACGDNPNNGPSGAPLTSVPAETGIFVDSPVEGLRYEAQSFSGNTERDGSFDVAEGETICFFVGQVELGCSEARELLTPIDLFEDATPTSGPVLNVVRLLLSLDADGDGSNGIDLSEIPADARLGGPGVDMAEFDIMSDSDLLEFIDTFGNDLTINEDDARDHFLQSLVDFNVLANDLIGDWNLSLIGFNFTDGLIQNGQLSIASEDLETIEAVVFPDSFTSFVLETETGLCFFDGFFREGFDLGFRGPIIRSGDVQLRAQPLLSEFELPFAPELGTVRSIEGQAGCFPSGLDPRDEAGDFGPFNEDDIVVASFRMDLIDTEAVYSEEDFFGPWEVISDQGTRFDAFEFNPFIVAEGPGPDAPNAEDFSGNQIAFASFSQPGFAFDVDVQESGAISFSTIRVIPLRNDSPGDGELLLPFVEPSELDFRAEFPEEGFIVEQPPFLEEICDYQGQLVPARDFIRGTYSCETSGDGIFSAEMGSDFHQDT